MKKVKKRILVAIGIIFTLLGIMFSYFLFMGSAEIVKIPNTSIYAVRNSITTVYFIKTDDGYIMIDTGANIRRMEASLNEANINIDDIRWIFLTHSDWDHIGTL